MRRLRRTTLFLLALTAAAVVAAGGSTFSAFSATTSNGPVSVSSASDWTAPSATAVIANTSGGLGLKTGATYNVYANVTDTGNPASGVSTVTANVSTVTTTGGSVALTACSTGCTVQGVTYGYKSAQLTENTAVGTKTWTVTSVDAAGNSSGAQSFTVSVDNTVPTVSAGVIAHVQAGPGVKAGGTYYVYGNATDASSGMANMTANVSNITTGQTAVTMSACSSNCTVAGVTYGFKSAQLTANAGLSAGAKTFTLTATDQAGNTSGTSSFSVTADNTQPTANSVQTANGGATVGRPEAGDTISLTYSQQLDPDSILSGWTGASTNVVVRISNAGAGNNDVVTFWNSTNTTQILALGSVNLGRAGWVPTGGSITFGATGTASTMAQATTVITLTLGTPSATASTVNNNTTMVWSSSTLPTDLAGNNATGNTRTETGGNDREF